MRAAMGQEADAPDEFEAAWAAAAADLIWLPAQKRYGRSASATNSDKVESLKVRAGCIFAVLKNEECCR